MKDFADVLGIFAPRLSTRGAFLIDIQFGYIVHRPVGDPLQIYADRFSGHYGASENVAMAEL
jgi:hypothetical protein